MSNIPPIFVINLARSTERRAHMTKMLDALDLKYEFIEAIDGEQLTDDQINEVYDEQAAIKYGGKVHHKGSIATYMSHVKVLQTIIDRDIPEALILEDDIRVSPDIKPFLERRDKLPKDYGILSLSSHRRREEKIIAWYRKSWKIYKDYIVGLPSGWLCGAYAYLVQAPYIREFMQYKYPIIYQYDTECFNTSCSRSIYYALKGKSVIQAIELFPSERLSDKSKRLITKDKRKIISQIKDLERINYNPGIFNTILDQVKRVIFVIISRLLIYFFLPKGFPNRILCTHKELSQSRWEILRYLLYLHLK